MQSILAEMARERRQRQSKAEAKSTPKKTLEVPKPSRKISPVVTETIDSINNDIKPALDIEMETLEEVALAFAMHADSREVGEMNEDLEEFEGVLRNIQDLLRQTKLLIVDTYRKTGNAIDAQVILDNTFKLSGVRERVTNNLQLLEGAAEATIDKIRFDDPRSRRIVDRIERIQAFGDEHFDEYTSRPIEIKMDVSGDVELARRLAAESPQEFTRRYEPVSEPYSPPRRRSSGRPTFLTLEEARSIVRSNRDLDMLTLQEILRAQGFDADIIRQVIFEM